MSILRSILGRKKGSTSKKYVPHSKYSETQKRYINTLDIIHDKSTDFQQIVLRLLLFAGTRPEFQKMDFGNEHDVYQIQNYMESAINTIAMQLETTIQSEFRSRKEILELENLYENLTTLALTADQKAELLEFEQIYKDDYLARATTSCEQNIIDGHNSSKRILEAEHSLHTPKLQKEDDIQELAQRRSSHFKSVTQSEQKTHHQRKMNQNPTLGDHSMKSLQTNLTSIQNIKNGAGTENDIATLHPDSKTENK